MSYRLVPSSAQASGFNLEWPQSNEGPTPLENPRAYIAHAAKIFAPLLKPGIVADSDAPSSRARSVTVLYPLFQLTPLLPASSSQGPRSTELPALTLLLKSLSQSPFKPARWTFTAGYFNMTPTTRNLLLSSLQQYQYPSHTASDSVSPHGTILTAHPHANGFFGSAGVSGLLPPAYTLMSKRFLEAVQGQGLDKRLSLHEWKRGMVGQPDGWTYHAKGLWVTLPGESSEGEKSEHESGPAITLIGSSNYTKRSHTLDLEANALILTTDKDLQRRLKGEEQHLMQYAGPKIEPEEFAKPERRVGLHVKIALWITNAIGGAL